MSEIWVLVTHGKDGPAPVTFELLSKANEISSGRNITVCAVLIGDDIKQYSASLFRGGAGKIYLADNPELSDFHEEIYAEIIAGFSRCYKPQIILGAATIRGRSLMPRIAVLLKTGLTADCTELEIEAETGNLIQTRPAFGGNILASIICAAHRPQMASVRPHVFQINTNTPSFKDGEIIEYKKDIPPPLKTILSQKALSSDSLNLTDSEIIVTAGMGTGGPEGIKLIKNFAELLGASLGASRSVVDNGWLDYKHQIGQTGTTVHPKTYIACGVSGAIQHLTGMQDSDCIIAINKDQDAPIFQIADIAVQCDIFDILPELIKQLKIQNTGV